MADEIASPPGFPPGIFTGKRLTGDVKSQLLADKFRKEANKLYLKGRIVEALRVYNRSLSCSIPGSAKMGLIYSSRASLYYDAKMYTRSLENVELARQYPLKAAQRSRLDRRVALCMSAMARFGDFDVRYDFFSLSRSPHPKYPKVIECLKIVESDEFARHVISTEDLDVGEVICIEEPIVVSPDAEIFHIRCWYCLSSNNFSLIPCPNCTAGLLAKVGFVIVLLKFSSFSDVLFKKVH